MGALNLLYPGKFGILVRIRKKLEFGKFKQSIPGIVSTDGTGTFDNKLGGSDVTAEAVKLCP